MGKTTTAINLAAALAASGHRTLLVDLDPQANASTGLGATRRPTDTAYQLMAGAGCRPAATLVSNLDIIPSTSDLAGAELELAGVDDREFRLDSAIKAAPFELDYEFIFFDCPPSLGLLTVNALVAADGILIPLQCEFFALEGIAHIMRTIELVRGRLNPNLEAQGIVLTMHDKRNNLSDLVAADARSFFGQLVYETTIPRNVRISEAPSHGTPVLLYDYRSPGSQAYVRLAAEFLRREARLAELVQ